MLSRSVEYPNILELWWSLASIAFFPKFRKEGYLVGNWGTEVRATVTACDNIGEKIPFIFHLFLKDYYCGEWFDQCYTWQYLHINYSSNSMKESIQIRFCNKNGAFKSISTNFLPAGEKSIERSET